MNPNSSTFMPWVWLHHDRSLLPERQTAWTSLPYPFWEPDPLPHRLSLHIPKAQWRSSCYRTWAHTYCRNGLFWQALGGEWHRDMSLLWQDPGTDGTDHTIWTRILPLRAHHPMLVQLGGTAQNQTWAWNSLLSTYQMPHKINYGVSDC